MEFSTTTQTSLFTPKLFLKTFDKTSCKISIFHPKFLQLPSRFKFYVHSRHPTRRPNYLRRKLIDPLPQVRENDTVYMPSFNDNVSVVKTDNLVEERRKLDYGLVENDNLVEERSILDYGLVETDNLVEERSNLDYRYGIDNDDKGLGDKDKILGDSDLLNKLESWVELCKAETEYWGFGTGHIFTVFEDSNGKVERVEVNEDEIRKRSGTTPMAGRDSEGEGGIDVISKISYAKELAREAEKGNNVIARDSPVSRYVVSGSTLNLTDAFHERTSSFLNAMPQNFQLSGFFPRVKRIGFLLMIGLILVGTVKKFFIEGENGQEDSATMENEMLRRKLKARAEKGEIKKDSVEVIHKDVEAKNEPMERPELNREELMKEIVKAKGYNYGLGHSKHFGSENSTSDEFNNKIQEIKMMARHARETEKRDVAARKNGEEDTQTVNFADKNQVAKLHGNGHVDSPVTFSNGNTRQIEVGDMTTVLTSFDDLVKDVGDLDSASLNSSLEVGNRDQAIHSASASLVDEQPTKQGCNQDERSPTTKSRVIRSVEEAREYLSRKGVKQDAVQDNRSASNESVDAVTITSEMETAEQMSRQFEKAGNNIDSSSRQPDSTDSRRRYNKVTGNKYVLTPESNRGEFGGGRIGGSNESTLFSDHEGSLCDKQSETPISIFSGEKGIAENTSHEEEEADTTFSPSILDKVSQSPSISVSLKNSSIQDEKDYSQNVKGEKNTTDLAGHEHSSSSAGFPPVLRTENWVEKNFHELEPIIKKMGEGFRGNYMVAKETTNEDYNSKDILLKSEGDSGELSWMKDEKLRDIVFRVRDNELAGREPFHQIDNESKLAFFDGLEKKVEEENKRLLNLHEYLHSNIENLDYGADGISMYDPLEKVVPRWKGPHIEKIPDFLNNNVKDRMPVVGGDNISKPQAQNSSQSDSSSAPLAIDDLNSRVEIGIPKSSKTIIEGSDGTTRVGKKSGKEFWQHTKKWSEGFLNSYNEETNPEVKAVMKDIGKDLDRWITEKEIKEAAELMDKLPEKGQKFVKSKLDKVKREMELFGPQAVVSKYREYADVKEDDFLWWLDLPCVLCIELYMKEEGEQRTGLYSLEMAPDLELDPKPNHVIAFEDAGDCKSLCYIIQHHLELIGNGNAFVIARQPKDAFREAKASGFSVTVIRKGELQLNVDQPLEEIEELIIEIGSKVYHDKIMQERSVDMSGFMKGIFGTSKPSRRRRPKKKLKKPNRR